MDIEVSHEKEYALIRLNGRLDATQASEVANAVQRSLPQGRSNLILDCSGLSYVASMGLRCFLLAHKDAQAAGGRLIFFGLNDNVRTVFAMTGFDKIAPVRANLEDALAGLK